VPIFSLLVFQFVRHIAFPPFGHFKKIPSRPFKRNFSFISSPFFFRISFLLFSLACPFNNFSVRIYLTAGNNLEQ
jgi:hypothetical protein